MFFLSVRVHQKHVMKGGRLEKICFVSTLLKIAPSIRRISKKTVKGGIQRKKVEQFQKICICYYANQSGK